MHRRLADTARRPPLIRPARRAPARCLSDRRRLRGAALAALAVLLAAPALAQDGGDAMAGRRLAERWCSNCHMIARDAQRGSSNGAPSFPSVARMKSATALSLHAFLATPHPPMPDLELSTPQLDDVTAFILSQRQD